MDYSAGLDVSMNETHICVLKRDGAIVLEAKASSTPEAIAAVLETAPACETIVLETDRNDARGLTHLARTGFVKPGHVNSLPAHAGRALIIARTKLVGQRVTRETQIRGLAVGFGVRLPRGLSPRLTEQVLQARGCRPVRGSAGAARRPQGRSGSGCGNRS